LDRLFDATDKSLLLLFFKKEDLPFLFASSPYLGSNQKKQSLSCLATRRPISGKAVANRQRTPPWHQAAAPPFLAAVARNRRRSWNCMRRASRQWLSEQERVAHAAWA